jgi:hypothetical protein
MQDRHAFEINRQFPPQVYQPAMCHVTTGDELAVQENNVTD